MLWKIRKSIGKGYCIGISIVFLLCSFILFSFPGSDIQWADLLTKIIAIASLFSVVLMLAAAFKKEPEESPPFFYSLDEDGKHILTNGTKKLRIDEEGNICSEQTLTQEEVSQAARMISCARADFYGELSKLDNCESTENKIRSKFELLQLTRKRHLITDEEYQQGKSSVILLDLSDLWDEYDLDSENEALAAKKKLKFLELLKNRSLIDEAEYTAEVQYISVDTEENSGHESDTIHQRLEQLKKLREADLIDESDYHKKKQEILEEV